ncbi:MAG TPA: hypothetical protein VKR78_02040, partial [Acidimicrobiales bacterium]|nr:hypothetical protein [Acidimicrobiales bacterium]
MTSSGPEDRAGASGGRARRPSDGAFGPNAWLVDDMYDRFLADPTSVSESWRDFFTDYRPAPLPAPMEALAREVAERGRPSEETAPPAPGSPDGVPPLTAGNGHVAAPAPWGTPAPPKAPPAGPIAPAPPAASAAPAAPAAVAAPRPEADQPVPLRGAASRIAANMTASLSVPTATSV